jgi:hypothetical protein
MATGRKNPLRGRVVRISDDWRVNVDRGTVLALAPARTRPLAPFQT